MITCRKLLKGVASIVPSRILDLAPRINPSFLNLMPRNLSYVIKNDLILDLD